MERGNDDQTRDKPNKLSFDTFSCVTVKRKLCNLSPVTGLGITKLSALSLQSKDRDANADTNQDKIRGDKLEVSRFCPLSRGPRNMHAYTVKINSYITGMRQTRSIWARIVIPSLEINIRNSALITRTRETCRINNPRIICHPV